MADMNKLVGQLLGSGAAGGFAGGLAGGLAGNLLSSKYCAWASHGAAPSSSGANGF